MNGDIPFFTKVQPIELITEQYFLNHLRLNIDDFDTYRVWSDWLKESGEESMLEKLNSREKHHRKAFKLISPVFSAIDNYIYAIKCKPKENLSDYVDRWDNIRKQAVSFCLGEVEFENFRLDFSSLTSYDSSNLICERVHSSVEKVVNKRLGRLMNLSIVLDFRWQKIQDE